MDYEHFVGAAARVVEFVGVTVLLLGALNLGVLAVIVAIRTLLSFALELEVSGRWPWQRARAAEGGISRTS